MQTQYSLQKRIPEMRGLDLDIRQLILTQALKGVGGALLVPGSVTIIGATFSEEQRLYAPDRGGSRDQ